MKKHEIPILDDENKFQMIYDRASNILFGVSGTCLKFLYEGSHCVQTCIASNKHISQTRNPNEKI